MLEILTAKIKLLDSNVNDFVSNFLKPYSIPSEAPFFVKNLPLFIKTIIYSLAILIPLSFIKIFFIGKRKFTYILLLFVGIIGLAIAGIFFGFLQLLFSF